jgi:hypothetical protein
MDIFGALISAVFGAFGGGLIRFFLDKYSQYKSERKLAYVHLLKVNLLLAAYTSSKAKFDELIDPLKSTFRQEEIEKEFQVPLILHEVLSKNSANFLFKESGTKTLVSAVKIFMQNLEDLKIPPNELTKLPQKVCLFYTDFLIYRTSLREAAELWLTYFEHGKNEWISSELLLYHKHLFKRFFTTAIRLQLGLAKHSSISSAKAQELLRVQVCEYARIGNELETEINKINRISIT